LIGYARINTQDLDTTLQKEKLEAAGCTHIFWENASGAKRQRPELDKALVYVREGETLVVFKLDRLARSLKDLLGIMDTLKEKGVGFRSLTESIDTTTPAGVMMMQMLGAVAEFERSMIMERTEAGRRRAVAKDVKFGPKALLSQDQVEAARKMEEDGKPAGDIAALFNVSKQTLYRVLANRTY